MTLEKILYRTSATATGGREGTTKTDGGGLDLKLARPKEMGGRGDAGTNPEQIFAAGYAACFLAATQFVAGKEKIAISPESTVQAAVALGPKGIGFAFDVELTIHLPGLTLEQATELVEKAHQVCPYSNATRGNIDVKLNVV